MTAVARQRFDKAGFFDWAERQDRRYELVNGYPVMLPYVTRNHQLVSTNIVVALAHRLDRTRYSVATGDFAVETADDTLRYADVMVEPAGGDGQARWTDRAILLVEVLSKTSIDRDFNEKLSEYTALQTCDTYLVCAQDAPQVWQWTRRDGRWPDVPLSLEGLEQIVELAVFGCTLPLSEIYFGVVSQPDPMR